MLKINRGGQKYLLKTKVKYTHNLNLLQVHFGIIQYLLKMPNFCETFFFNFFHGLKLKFCDAAKIIFQKSY